jgi:predicted DNA-binding transcriptional regulator YafY
VRRTAARRAQGAQIKGEAGFGYVLKPGFTLPPLAVSLEEVEALALGARWVEGPADEGLRTAANGALAKIAAVLPPERAEALIAGRKLALAYVDKAGCSSARVVWPVALGLFDHPRMLAARRETLPALDRMEKVAMLEERPPKARRTLLIHWRRAEGLDE